MLLSKMRVAYSIWRRVEYIVRGWMRVVTKIEREDPDGWLSDRCGGGLVIGMGVAK